MTPCGAEGNTDFRAMVATGQELTLTNGMRFEICDAPAVFTLTNEECGQLTAERFKAKQKAKAKAKAKAEEEAEEE
jgi:hypothetical protein